MKRTRLQCDIIIFKRCRAKARRVILEAKTSSCQQYCSSLTNNSNLFHVWQVIKSFSGQRSSPHIPTLVANGISGKNNQNKAQDKQSGKSVRSLQQSFKLHSALTNYSLLSKIQKIKGGLGLTPPLELDILQNFVTCAKEINCFHIFFAC